MPLLPYDTLVIDSPLRADEARARLEGATGVRTWNPFARPAQSFLGEVVGPDVRIQRTIRYRNSFLPRIRGRIEPAAQGSRLVATMALHPAVAVFLAAWFAVALTISIPVTAALFTRGPFEPMLLIPIGMLLGCWALVSGSFTAEARIARRELTALLDGRPAGGTGSARAA